MDSAGNVYVADGGNFTVRKVTPLGAVTTLAGLAGSFGTNDGLGSSARFGSDVGMSPSGLAVDGASNIYVADSANETIRKMTPVGTNWMVTTLAGQPDKYGSADGSNGAAQFWGPSAVAVDNSGNIYVADSGNDTIRKVTPAGVVSTWAGLAGSPGTNDGIGGAARFNFPFGIALDTASNIYVADAFNYTIRKITPDGTVSTLAGSPGVQGHADGTGSAARFNDLGGLAVDVAGNVFVTDSGSKTIREVNPQGVVSTLAGLALNYGSADGTGLAARFDNPAGVALDAATNAYVADYDNETIRKGYPASTVPAPDVQPPGLSPGQFGFGITGLPGLAVDIESSIDLTHWQILSTVLLVGGTNYFANATSNMNSQFFRAHLH